MPTQRHRTVIEVDVDDRKIRGLDRTLHRAFDDQMLVAFERMLDRTARTVEQMTKAAEKFEETMGRAGRDSGGGGGGRGRVPPSSGRGDTSLQTAIVGLSRNVQQLSQQQQGGGGGGGAGGMGGGRGPGFWNRAGATAVGTYIGGLGSRMGSGEGFFSQAMGGIPIFGGFLQGALNSIHRYAGMHAQAQTQISRQVGTVGAGRVRGAFTRFGLARPEAMQQAASLAQMSGRSGEGLDEGLVNSSLGLQMYGGIREAPGVVRAAEVGGGRAGSREMFQAVSAGILTGIREARLGQFIGVATQVLEQARLEGTDTRLQTVLRTFTGFGGLGGGFRGEQGQQAGMQAMGALRRFQPGADVASLVGLRSVGFGQRGGPSYHEALRMFQEQPAEVVPQLLQTIRGMAPGNRDAQIELMRQIAPRLLGFTPSIQQAESMVGGDLSMFGQEVSSEQAGSFMSGRQGRLAGSFGVAGQEAAFRNRQLTVGSRTYGASRGIQRAEMSMTETVLPRVAAGIEGILNWLQETWGTFQEGGFAAVIRDSLRDVLGAIPGMPELPGGQTTGTDVRNAAVRGGGGIQSIINDGLAATLEAAGADPDGETVQQLRRTAERGRDMAAGSNDRVEPTGPGARGAITPGPAVAPTDAGGPEASLGAALRRARDELNNAAGIADRIGMPREGEVAVG